jgi:hypothetical protein
MIKMMKTMTMTILPRLEELKSSSSLAVVCGLGKGFLAL